MSIPNPYAQFAHSLERGGNHQTFFKAILGVNVVLYIAIAAAAAISLYARFKRGQLWFYVRRSKREVGSSSTFLLPNTTALFSAFSLAHCLSSLPYILCALLAADYRIPAQTFDKLQTILWPTLLSVMWPTLLYCIWSEAHGIAIAIFIESKRVRSLLVNLFFFAFYIVSLPLICVAFAFTAIYFRRASSYLHTLSDSVHMAIPQWDGVSPFVMRREWAQLLALSKGYLEKGSAWVSWGGRLLLALNLIALFVFVPSAIWYMRLLKKQATGSDPDAVQVRQNLQASIYTMHAEVAAVTLCSLTFCAASLWAVLAPMSIAKPSDMQAVHVCMELCGFSVFAGPIQLLIARRALKGANNQVRTRQGWEDIQDAYTAFGALSLCSSIAITQDVAVHTEAADEEEMKMRQGTRRPSMNWRYSASKSRPASFDIHLPGPWKSLEQAKS